MFIVHVFIDVKPEHHEEFLAATITNARASIQEHGIVRFDVMQAEDDPNQIVLYEVYRTKDAAASHKETAHYKLWKETAANMMTAPRTKKIYDAVFLKH